MDTLAQARLADELGYGCWWTVEHHGTGEFSMSSTPELFNLLVIEATSRIRVGHSGVLAPFAINHPIRVAERAAFLDVMSGGRLEMGLARSGHGEWINFSLDSTVLRTQMEELFRMLPAIWNDPRFSWDSDLIRIPELDVIPKPVQQPHPPLWQMCISPESFEMAGRLGVGAIGTTLLEQVEGLAGLRATYHRCLATAEPVSEVINGQFGIFTFVHCVGSRQEAIRSRAAEAALWYINGVPRAFRTPRKILIESFRGRLDTSAVMRGLAAGNVEDDEDWDPDDPVPVVRLLNRQLLGYEIDPEEAYDVLEPMDAVIIGDPDACLAKMMRFADIGVDRLLCFQQFGILSQAQTMASMARVGRELLPLFDLAGNDDCNVHG